MSKEIEVKFFVSNLEPLISQLNHFGAKLDSERTHETNLRFDTTDRRLTRASQVLRLRQDARVRVTFKGPGEMEGGARSRQELEYEADDFEAANAVFQALGYEVSFVYEKFRATYHFENVEVVLDETPIGTFTEIEGENGEAIQFAASRLGLDWDARINDSYVVLFERVKRALSLPFRDMTFLNFEGINVTQEALGIQIKR